MTTLTYSKTLTAGTPENVNDLNTILNDVKNWANGGITNSNLSGTAAITDANLASPNNSAYKDLVTVSVVIGDTIGAATHLILNNVGLLASGTATGTAFGIPVVYLDSADYAVAGLTTKLRVRANTLVNNSNTGVTFTVGLYPIGTLAGGADQWSSTLGTVVSGSTVAIASPAANSKTQQNSGDFTFPTNDYYCLGVAVSGSVGADSRTVLNARLQIRNV